MTAGELLKILLLILLSSVKFIAGPPFAYVYNQKYEFGFTESVIYSIIGGMLGVYVFTFFNDQVLKFIHYIRQKKRKHAGGKGVYSKPTADVNIPLKIKYMYVDEKTGSKRIFTKRNRRIIRIWKKYGLAGIAFVTPCIISIPVGTIVANSFVKNKKKIFLYMFISIVCWSLIIHSVFYFKLI